jgi:hypothetical protein
MSFLHLWAIPIGATAMSIPLLIHWMTRPRPVTLKLSTVRFVLDVVRQRRARNRLRDWLILALRSAAICAFALMISRPLSQNSPQAAQSPTESALVKVVILDVSQSMAATSQGIQSAQRARPIAAKHVGYQSNTLANLILAAAAPQSVFDRPSNNFSVLLDQVTKAVTQPQRLNVQPALNLAAEMLANVEAAKHELVIVSDFQRTHWASADFSGLPVDTNIQLESVAPAETAANMAILRIGTQGRVEQDRPFRLEVDVGNYSATSRQVTAEIKIEEKLFRVQGQCAAGGRTTLVTEATFSSEGWHAGDARLVGIEDSLNEDNQRSLALLVHAKPNYLLLTRQSADTKPSSSYFLERAIAPNTASARIATENVVRVDPLRVTREAIMKADLLILDHPGKITDENLQSIAALVVRGRGLLYVVAEPIDATNLKILAKNVGTNLQLPVEFSPPIAGQTRKSLFITEFKLRQMPFKIFGEEASAILAPIRFSGGLSSRRVEGALLDDVLANYNDQSACLVVTACGAGAVAVLNADLAASTLPSSPAFVPIVGELTSHLLGRDRSPEAVACGEPLAVYLPPAASPVVGLRIESHSGSTIVDSETLGDLHEESVGVMWHSSAVGPPGIYDVKRGTQTVFAISAAIPAEESDLTAISAEVLTDRLAGGRHVRFRSAFQDDRPRDDAWTWLAVMSLCFVFAEIIGLRLFKS